MKHDLSIDRIPVGPPPPGAAIEYRQSSWIVELGPLRIAHHRQLKRADGRVVGTAPRLGRLTASWQATGAVVAGALTLGAMLYYGQNAATAHAHYSVSQGLPATVAPVEPLRPAHARRVHLARPVSAAAPAPTCDDPLGDESGPRLGVDQAVAAAWQSGESQDWAESGSHGIIVPGPLEQHGGTACRAFSRLTRQAGAADSVEQWRKCTGAAATPDLAPQP